MTKAQEVRSKRLEGKQHDLTIHAEKVFDWILDLIDADTKKGYWGPIELCLFDKQNKLKHTSFKGIEYDLLETLLRFDRLEFFSRLKEVVEQEDGYEAFLETSDDYWDAKAILFKVVIK